MFPVEVCLHERPSIVYDCISWDPLTRKYKLRDDNGQTLEVTHDKFTPVSLYNEELVQFTADGTPVTVEEQSEMGAGFSFIGSGAPSNDVPEGKPAPKKAKNTSARITDEVKQQVKRTIAELLKPCGQDRDLLAKAAGEVTGDDPISLVEKYKHLDNGRFRMVLGNKMRGILVQQVGA